LAREPGETVDGVPFADWGRHRRAAITIAVIVGISVSSSYHSHPSQATLSNITMYWHYCFAHVARELHGHVLNWRAARTFCAVWFTLTSISFPFSLSPMTGKSCTTNPGQQCRCSLAKRMSETCCCGRESKPERLKSCCSVSRPTRSQFLIVPTKCCQEKSTANSQALTTSKVELSVGPCDCGSESPNGVSLVGEPRLAVRSLQLPFPVMTVAVIALPVDRVESAPLQPPVPPPKVVL
jgi:hypothetical protein